MYCVECTYGAEQKVSRCEIGALNLENGRLDSATDITDMDASYVERSEYAALIMSNPAHEPGYLYILTKDGRVFYSQPEDCKDCRFIDIDSLGKDIYVMYSRKSDKRFENSCFVSKWNPENNRLEKPVELLNGCGTFIVVKK